MSEWKLNEEALAPRIFQGKDAVMECKGSAKELANATITLIRRAYDASM